MTDADVDDLTEVFRQEANGILAAASASLLALERNEASQEARNDSLRHFHTLKGMANMEGHPDLATACHEAEALLLQDPLPPMDALLRRVDAMRRWLEDHGMGARGDASAEGIQYVTVQTDRLDSLLNIAGELTVTSTRMQYESKTGSPAPETLRALDQLVRNLQTEVMRTRLLPARTLFAGLPRLVRDAAAARGIEAALDLDETTTIGLDRSLVDRLSGMLAHLVQNSIAHGIELPAERVAAGKPARGVIRVRLHRDREMVSLTIEDDGRGLPEDAIKKLAVDRGVWSAAQAAHATTAQLADVVFSAGFSTSATADSHSGRGIGLTAVRETLRELGGSVQVASRQGAGAKVTLTLPPTVALIETVVVEARGATIAIPLRNVLRIRDGHDVTRIGGKLMMLHEGRAIPLINIDGAPARTDDARFSIVLESPRGEFALAVDALRGTHSTVLKPLDPHLLEAHPNAMGAAVLGNGALAIIVDPELYSRRREA